VAAADDRLDDLVRTLAKALLRVVDDDVKSPRYLRYFATTPSSIIRLGLESEIARVRGWVDSLTSEAEKDLQDLGAQLGKLVEQATRCWNAGARLRQRAAITGYARLPRSSTTSTVPPFPLRYPDQEGRRAALAARLARRFFRHSTRSPKEDPQPVPPNGQPTTPSQN